MDGPNYPGAGAGAAAAAGAAAGAGAGAGDRPTGSGSNVSILLPRRVGTTQSALPLTEREASVCTASPISPVFAKGCLEPEPGWARVGGGRAAADTQGQHLVSGMEHDPRFAGALDDEEQHRAADDVSLLHKTVSLVGDGDDDDDDEEEDGLREQPSELSRLEDAVERLQAQNDELTDQIETLLGIKVRCRRHVHCAAACFF